MRYYRVMFHLLTSVVILCMAFPLFAQTSATLSGTVSDPTGAVLPDVKIVLVNISKNIPRQAITNKEGYFSLSNLDPGAYRLRAQREGFTAVDVPEIILNTADRRELQIKLKVGRKDETITVEASAVGMVDIDPSVNTLVDQRFIANLPLKGRSLTSLLAITPGVVQTGSATFSINGIRDNNNYFTIDGVAANTGIGTSTTGLGAAGAGQVINTTAGNNLTQSLIAADSMEEFRVQSSGSAAEYGRSSGGQIQLTTRSGSNAFHGTVFDYLRNDIFDAINPYTKFLALTKNPNAPVAKPAIRQNNFGGTFSGPVRIPGLYNGKDKTFFFYSYEGLRLLSPTSGYWYVPPAAERTNSNIYYPGLQPYIAAMALPNSTDPTLRNYPIFIANYSTQSGHDANAIKLDQVINSKLTLFGRYAHTPSNRSGRDASAPNQLSQSVYGSEALTLGSTLLLSNAVSNEFRGNWSKTDGTSRYWLDTFGGASLPTAAMLKQMFPAAYGATPDNSYFFLQLGQDGNRGPGGMVITPWTTRWQYGTQAANTQRQINLVDNLSWIRGKHSFKFGVDWRYLFPAARPYAANNFQQIIGQRGGYGYPDNWMPGMAVPTQAQIDAALAANQAYTAKAVATYDLSAYGLGIITAPMSQVASLDSIVVHVHNLSLYAQDSFRVTPRLTLDYGVRWDYNPAPRGANGKSLYVLSPFDFNNPSTARLAQAGTPLYDAKKNAFAPRVGVSYQLWSRPGRETVLRGSYGLFYDSGAANGMNLTYLFPHQRSTTWPIDGPWMEVTPPALPSPALTAPYGGMVAAFPNYTYPKTHQWNVAVQQGLGAKQSLTLSYVGSAGRNLIRQATIYQGLPQVTSSWLYIWTPADTSDYHAVQANYVRQLSHGLQAMANYTFGKSLDTASTEFNNAPIVNGKPLPGSRGPSDFDVRHNFNATISYDIPTLPVQWKPARSVTSHWSVDSIITSRTGVPLTVTFVSNLAGAYAMGTQNYRVNIVPDQPLWVPDALSLGGMKLNPAAFSKIGSYIGNGNEPRGYVRGPGLNQFDMTVRREFKVMEGLKLQWRVDAFNVFNMTTLGNPNLNLGNQSSPTNWSANSGFGRITSTGGTGGTFGTGGSRSMQMALKLIF